MLGYGTAVLVASHRNAAASLAGWLALRSRSLYLHVQVPALDHALHPVTCRVLPVGLERENGALLALCPLGCSLQLQAGLVERVRVLERSPTMSCCRTVLFSRRRRRFFFVWASQRRACCCLLLLFLPPHWRLGQH